MATAACRSECQACRRACATALTHCRVLVRAVVPDGRRSQEVVARLVEQWWPEVYAFAQRHGARGPDAEDVTQAYFTRFLEKGYLRRLESWDGCIRPFLLTSLRHFLSNARNHARALKRGGRAHAISLGREGFELVDEATPELLLEAAERRRAMRRAIAAVRSEARRSDQRQRLESLLVHLEGGRGSSQEIAGCLGLSPGAARVALHRLRRRLAAALEDGNRACVAAATHAGQTTEHGGVM